MLADANQHADSTLYGVQVLNMVDGNKQSMLVAVPEGGRFLLILGPTLLGLCVVARRYGLT
jgi:hypothetical protein